MARELYLWSEIQFGQSMKWKTGKQFGIDVKASAFIQVGCGEVLLFPVWLKYYVQTCIPVWSANFPESYEDHVDLVEKRQENW